MSCCWRNPISFFHLKYTPKTSDYKDEKKKNLQFKNPTQGTKQHLPVWKCEISISNSVDFAKELCISYERSKTHIIPGLVYDSVWPEAEHANSLSYDLILSLEVNRNVTTKNTTNVVRVLLKWLGKLVAEHFLKNKMRTWLDYLVPTYLKRWNKLLNSHSNLTMNLSRNTS